MKVISIEISKEYYKTLKKHVIDLESTVSKTISKISKSFLINEYEIRLNERQSLHMPMHNTDKFRVGIDDVLYEELKSYAIKHHKSISLLMNMVIVEYLSKHGLI